ncbi:hypothetical protein Sjap_009009 [Stephania japonica]|uniref:Uncharacterized protein n=1 Tax=Stephania japonica TaxID=461633 RepID=A0AAP0PF65_9MAGN
MKDCKAVLRKHNNWTYHQYVPRQANEFAHKLVLAKSLYPKFGMLLLLRFDHC